MLTPGHSGLLLHFRVRHHTILGQNLFLIAKQEEFGNLQTPLPMNFQGIDDCWVCDVELPITGRSRKLQYKYILSTNRELDHAPESNHTLTLGPILKPAEIDIWDSVEWTNPVQGPLTDSVFVDVVRRRERRAPQAPAPVDISKDNGVTVSFSVFCPHVRGDQTLKVVGSVPELGNWNPSMALELNDYEFPRWSGTQTFSKESLRFEFKFVIVGDDGSVFWESGDNRSCSGLASDRCEPAILVLSEWYLSQTKGRGIFCPLASLKPDESCGIGQDTDAISTDFILPMQTCLEAMSAKALTSNGLSLTCNGMGSVNFDCSESEFEFVFGKDKVCRVHSILAEFLSPKIARMRRCDISYDVYTFKDSEMFGVFESLVSSLRVGEAIRVEKSNFPALLRLSEELENGELLSSLLQMMDPESLSLDEAILLLQVGCHLGTAFSNRFRKLRDFVASHFHELEKEILDDLDLETTQLLLSSPSLQIEDEDSLYDFVLSRSETNLSFTSLFEFVCFDYLSVDRIENFTSFVSENFLYDINSGIWRQICRRLILEPKPTGCNPRVSKDAWKIPRKTQDKHSNVREFRFEEDPLDGIIAHLTRQYGNVHTNGIVRVTADSVFYNDYIELPPEHAVDLGSDSVFASGGAGESMWLCYDFKKRRIIPTGYSLRSNRNGLGGSYAPSWVIEVTNDREEDDWLEIDSRISTNDLNGRHVTAHFTIPRVPSEGFRFFRLMTVPYHYENDLELTSMEIFGFLYEEVE